MLIKSDLSKGKKTDKKEVNAIDILNLPCPADCIHRDRNSCIADDHCVRRAGDLYEPREGSAAL